MKPEQCCLGRWVLAGKRWVIRWGRGNACLEPDGLLGQLRFAHFVVCKLYFKRERNELCFIFFEYRKVNNDK